MYATFDQAESLKQLSNLNQHRCPCLEVPTAAPGAATRLYGLARTRHFQSPCSAFDASTNAVHAFERLIRHKVPPPGASSNKLDRRCKRQALFGDKVIAASAIFQKTVLRHEIQGAGDVDMHFDDLAAAQIKDLIVRITPHGIIAFGRAA